MTTLSADQLDQYRRDGFAPLGRLLDDATVEALRREEARFRANPMPNDDPTPGQMTIFRSQVAPCSQAVRDVCIRGPQIPAMAQLIGPDVLFWYVQFVTKLPDGDSGRTEFPWHQDQGYLPYEPMDSVTVWTALDDVDEANGCVWVLPGSHRRGLLPHAKPSASSWHLTVAVEGDGIPVHLRVGEAVAFSSLTLHRSLLNRTDRPRRGFFMQYARPTARIVATGGRLLDDPNAWMVLGDAPIPSQRATGS